MPARVLVIEDNAANLELMTYLLHAFGHVTQSASDGDAGLAAARSGTFDLVICDIQLPKRDGFEVARELAAAERAVPLVAVTAYARVGDREKVLAAGFTGYISKPIVPETFVGEVEAYLPPALRSAGRSSSHAPEAPASAPASAAGAKAAILVVDDDDANLQLMRSLLEPSGYTVGVARGVHEALARLAGGQAPDLIASDLHLQDGTGYDLIAALKCDPRLREVPFLFLSSTAGAAEERARGFAMGARKFIVRPIDPPALLAEIEGCLRSG